MINNVVLVGRMTRDAELRYTPSNVAVATFSLAVNRNFKGANGERETDFINCVIWRQQAENLANWAISVVASIYISPISTLISFSYWDIIFPISENIFSCLLYTSIESPGCLIPLKLNPLSPLGSNP